MARPLDPKRRQELLDRAVDYVVANGISDLSLRPLAAALGTRVVGLFGATDPERNGPLPRGAVVQNISSQPPDYLRGDYVRLDSYSAAMLSLSVEQVLAAAEQEISITA